jgi:hypothetical protein
MKIKTILPMALLSLLVAGSLAPSGAWAQDNKRNEDPNTRTLQGIVTDPSGKPVEGAVVQLKDTKTLQIRSFYTLADGSYHFAGLSTNVDYEVKADKDGATSGTKTLGIYDNRKTATLNLKLK